MVDYEDAVRDVAEILEGGRVPHAFAGSIALAYHGVLRPSTTVDLIVGPEDLILRVLGIGPSLEARGYVPHGPGRYRNGVFEVRFQRPSDDVERGALKRRLRGRFFTKEWRQYSVVSVEDLALLHLRDYRRGQDAVDLDIVKRLLAGNERVLDAAYLHQRAEVEGLGEVWSRTQRAA